VRTARLLARMLGGGLALAAVVLVAGALLGFTPFSAGSSAQQGERYASRPAAQLLTEGRRVFRYDTFGDQSFWGGALQLHRAIAGAANGGVGPGLSPKSALAAGLKVDAAALPRRLKAALRAGRVDLDDPATTLALLRLNAVVGVRGFFNRGAGLRSVGITCALCHSMVNDSFAPGIGARLDGWPNRDLNVGAIISLAPNLRPFTDLLGVDEATVKRVLAAWGPGKFDAALVVDGKAFRPDGRSAATLLPPAFGLSGVNLATYTGNGTVTYWNAFVANLEMHGRGNFFDPRLNNPDKFPIAVRAGLFDVRNSPDLVSGGLPALHLYQLALPAPRPPKGSFDRAAARRGRDLFARDCATCHVPPTFSEPGTNLHRPAEICIDSFQADRSPTGMYRTTPLRGLWTHQKGGFFHDGRFPSLAAVVDHYDGCFGLGLSQGQRRDLVEYLKSL
jgi:hypothetical protein